MSAPHRGMLPSADASGAEAIPAGTARLSALTPRLLSQRPNALTQPRPRFTRSSRCRRYPHHRSRLSNAPCAPVIMPEGTMPGPPGSGVRNPPAGTALAPLSGSHLESAPRTSEILLCYTKGDECQWKSDAFDEARRFTKEHVFRLQTDTCTCGRRLNGQRKRSGALRCEERPCNDLCRIATEPAKLRPFSRSSTLPRFPDPFAAGCPHARLTWPYLPDMGILYHIWESCKEENIVYDMTCLHTRGLLWRQNPHLGRNGPSGF